jgi:hypothetical protein
MLRFGSSRAEEGRCWQRMARWRGRRGGGADGSRRWELMLWWAVLGQKAERSGPCFGGSEGETKMG